MAKRKNYTNKKERISLYLNKICRLRNAEIAMNETLFFQIAQEITALHRQFEKEDEQRDWGL